MERGEFYGRILTGLRGELGRTGRYTVLYVDVDGMKALNDEHGHRAGDRILLAVEAFVTTVAGATGIVGHLTNDEFVAVFPLWDESYPVGRALIQCEGIPISLSIGSAEGDARDPHAFGETLERARASLTSS